MVRTLAPGAVNVSTKDLAQAVGFAAQYGFPGLDFSIGWATELGAEAAGELFSSAGVSPIVFGLPVEWRKDDETWRAGLEKLPQQAKVAQALGCTRTATWVLPGSNDRTLDENIVFHVERFGPIAEILGEHGITLGLEYIGPKTLRDQFKHPFPHTQDGMLEVAAKIGPNVGLLVDAWHWYTSGGTKEDLLRLNASQIAYVHINDAPEGVDVDAQLDHDRRLPGQTGVIDLASFLGALREIGYDGPIAVEPFSSELKNLPDDDARLTAVRDSLVAVGL